MLTKPLRVALGSLLIQKQYSYSDRELMEQIAENPYYQYFIGLLRYQQEPLFTPSLLVEFKKHLNKKILGEINERILDFNNPKDPLPNGGGDSDTNPGNPSHSLPKKNKIR